MSLSGDNNCTTDVNRQIATNKKSCIRLGTSVLITNNGQLSSDLTNHMVTDVVEVIDATVEQVLHLIGYSYESVQHLLNTDGLLFDCEETTKYLEELGPRAPAPYLVTDNRSLYGVVIDGTGECHLVGRVDCVVSDGTVCHFNRDHKWDIISSAITTNLDIQSLISNETNYVTGHRSAGLAFIQKEKLFCQSSTGQLCPLILLLSGACLLIEDYSVFWTRLVYPSDMSDDLIVKSIKLSTNDYVVINKGAYLRNVDHFELIGADSSVYSLDEFMAQSGCHFANNFTEKDDNSVNLSQESNGLQLTPMEALMEMLDINEEDSDVYLSDNDYYEKDSIS